MESSENKRITSKTPIASILSFAFGGVALALTYIESLSKSFPTIEAIPFAVSAFILALVGLLRKETFLPVVLGFCISVLALVLLNWVYLAILVMLPAVPLLRFPAGGDGLGGGFGDSLADVMPGLIAAAIVISVLPLVGVSIMAVFMIALIVAVVLTLV